MKEMTYETEEAVKKVTSLTSEYETFIDSIESAHAKYDDYRTTEQEALAEAFSKFSDYTDRTVPADKVSETHEEFMQTLREPVFEATWEYITQTLDLLSIQLRSSEEDSLRRELKGKSRDKLVELRQDYEKLVEDLSKYDEENVILIRLGNKVEEKPHHLLNLSEHIQPTYKKTSKRADKLANISEILDRYGWINLPRRKVGVFSMDWLDQDIPEPADIEPHIEGIASSVEKIDNCNIYVKPTISKEIGKIVDQPQNCLLEEISDLETELKGHSETAEILEPIPDIIETAEDVEIGSIDIEHLEKIDSNFQAASPESVGDIYKLLNNGKRAYDKWKENIQRRWDVYSSAFDFLSGSADIEKPVVLDQNRQFSELLAEEPVQALRELNEVASALETHQSDLGSSEVLTRESIQLLFDLIEEGTVSFSDYETTTIEDLNNIINLQVQIDEGK